MTEHKTKEDILAAMTQDRWDALGPYQRDRLRDDSGLTQQLVGLEGWRVEVVETYDPSIKRRFIVAKSTGWRPCHLEISRRNAFGGSPAHPTYRSVTKIERVR